MVTPVTLPDYDGSVTICRETKREWEKKRLDFIDNINKHATKFN